MADRIFTDEELANPSEELINSLKASIPDYSEYDNFLNQQQAYLTGSLGL